METRVVPVRWGKHRFRSRAEARWAVFFDGIGVEFQYEPEQFELSIGVCYTPDFYLCKQNIYVEVKHRGLVAPSQDEQLKAMSLAIDTGTAVLMLFGDVRVTTQARALSGYMFYPDATMRCCMWWVRCPRCGAVDIVSLGKIEHKRTCACVFGRSFTSERDAVILRAMKQAHSLFP